MDSSRKIKYNKLKPLLNCRDFISNIYRLFINLYNPKVIFDYNENVIHKENYVFQLLKVFLKKIDKKLYYISYKINYYFIENCFNAIKKIENKMLMISEENVKKLELNIFEFYDYCMKLIYPILIENDNLIFNNFINYKSMKGGDMNV